MKHRVGGAGEREEGSVAVAVGRLGLRSRRDLGGGPGLVGTWILGKPSAFPARSLHRSSLVQVSQFLCSFGVLDGEMTLFCHRSVPGWLQL